MRYALFLIALSAWAQTPIVITGPITDASGAALTGKIAVENPLMICGTSTVPKNSRTVAITAGVLSTPLYATSDCTDASGRPVVYTARLTTNNGASEWAYLSIPATPATQVLSAVMTRFAPSSVMPLSGVGFGAVLPGQSPLRSSDGRSWIGVYPGSGGGGGGSWGTVTGTIANQTDLMGLLNGKSDTTHTHPSLYAALLHGHEVSDVTGLQGYLDGKASLGGSYANPNWITSLGWDKITGATTVPTHSHGTGAPETTPGKYGDTYADDDANGLNYTAYCTTSSACWRPGGLASVGSGLVLTGTVPSTDPTLIPQWVSTTGAPTGSCTAGTRAIDPDAHLEYFCDGTWHAVGTTYTLPAATTGARGGITVGTRLTVTGDVLSADDQLPSQTGNSGKVLGTNGTSPAWVAQTGGGSTGLYSGTLAFSSAIAPGACDSKTLTATGITTGKTLALGLPSGLAAALEPRAVVTASDVVTVQLCNGGDADVTPGSATYSVRDMDSLGYLTASATIDWASLAPGQCSTNTITLTGAATGDNVAAGWPSGLNAGLTTRMVVTAANTVTAQLCNVLDADIDPASATFKAAITK